MPKGIVYGKNGVHGAPSKMGNMKSMKHPAGGLIVSSNDKRSNGKRGVIYSDDTYNGRKMS